MPSSKFCILLSYWPTVSSAYPMTNLSDRILNRVAQEYRREKWWSLLTNVLTTAIKSAYLLANIPDYIKLSLEMMAEEIVRSVETKTRIQVDILQAVTVSIQLLEHNSSFIPY